jgi:hypothetical protein
MRSLVISPRLVLVLPAGVAGALLDAAARTHRFCGKIFTVAGRVPGAILAPAAPDPTPGGPALPRQAPTSLLLEGDTDTRAVGIFAVENVRDESVLARLTVSAFSDSTERTITPTAELQPAEFRLEPGEQLLIQVAAVLDEEFEPGVRYHATIGLPGLSEATVPIAACRRLASQPELVA